MIEAKDAARVTHFGRVVFGEGGTFVRVAGSASWKVQPIPGFGLAIGPPLAQVRIVFDAPVPAPYTVLVTAERTATAPMLVANCGDIDERGFVVHMFEPVASRTLQNGSFSFVVLVTEG